MGNEWNDMWAGYVCISMTVTMYQRKKGNQSTPEGSAGVVMVHLGTS